MQTYICFRSVKFFGPCFLCVWVNAHIDKFSFQSGSIVFWVTMLFFTYSHPMLVDFEIILCIFMLGSIAIISHNNPVRRHSLPSLRHFFCVHFRIPISGKTGKNLSLIYQVNHNHALWHMFKAMIRWTLWKVLCKKRNTAEFYILRNYHWCVVVKINSK